MNCLFNSHLLISGHGQSLKQPPECPNLNKLYILETQNVIIPETFRVTVPQLSVATPRRSQASKKFYSKVWTSITSQVTADSKQSLDS